MPQSAVVQGGDGNFYGTTWTGGTSTNCDPGVLGCGTVFKITPQGTLTTLWEFDRTDGGAAEAGLVQASDGSFYGTSNIGGTNNDGTVFKITSQGTLTTLWQFSGADGQYPQSGVVRGSDGNFYGTTRLGGTNGYGTVFKITPQGIFTPLWQFNGFNGQEIFAGLVQGGDGNFYGTTQQGGLTNLNGGLGLGTVFKITSQGTLTTLYQFGGLATDGTDPVDALVQCSDGDFYGTTEGGGTNNYGTVFKITSQGTLTTLWQFSDLATDGAYPVAGLVQGSDGNFYGTTINGGTNKYGTAFRITPQGTLTTLWQFGGPEGKWGDAGLVQGSDGNFYGTAKYGGTSTNCTSGCGTVFKLSIPINPPANQISSAQVDSSGTNLVFSVPSVFPETYQLQFSPSMNPTNWSNVVGVCVSNSLGAALTVTNFGGAAGAQGFYRFAITP